MPRLEIDNYYVEELLVKSNSSYEYDPESLPGGIEPDINFDFYRKDEADPRFLVKFRVELGEGDAQLPYHIRLLLFASFDASNDANQTLIDQLVATNAAPILYGIARGIVGQTTAQAVHGRFVLPTVNFIELMNEKVRALQAVEAPTSITS
jgi:preprotein translocase subunit SecB